MHSKPNFELGPNDKLSDSDNELAIRHPQPGNSGGGRLGALKNMIEAAGELIEDGLPTAAISGETILSNSN